MKNNEFANSLRQFSENSEQDKINSIIESVNNYNVNKLKSKLNLMGYGDNDVVQFICDVNEYTEYMKATKGEASLSDDEKLYYLDCISVDVKNKSITKNKELVLILGLPGAGKSTALKQIEQLYKTKFYTIDSDIFKSGIDDLGNKIFKGLQEPLKHGIDVEYIHSISSRLAKLALELLTNNNYDVSLPKVGDNLNSIKNLIEETHSKGYKIYVHFIFTTVETSLKRNLYRFKISPKETRRLVPPEVIIKAGYKPLRNFIELISLSDKLGIDDYGFWDNESKDLKGPQLIFEKEKVKN